MRDSGVLAVASKDLQSIARLGSPWLLQREISKHRGKLPCNVCIQCSISNSESVVFPGLTVERVDEYSSAYFNTFNVPLPLLDLNIFKLSVFSSHMLRPYPDFEDELRIELPSPLAGAIFTSP
jgi:hypothetical protein